MYSIVFYRSAASLRSAASISCFPGCFSVLRPSPCRSSDSIRSPRSTVAAIATSFGTIVGIVYHHIPAEYRIDPAVLPANFYINVQQMLHNYICCNIKAQQMLQLLLFNLWRFRSKCWTIYIAYKHSVAAAFIMALIACWISFFREF